LLLFVFLGVLLQRANVLTGAFLKSVGDALRTRTAAVGGLILLVTVLMVVLISRLGVINAQNSEQRVERNRDSNRLVITEDKDGCLDMRTLGRSNGVYMSIKPCKPGGDKNQPPASTDQQQPNQY